LHKCVTSLLRQTQLPTEILLVGPQTDQISWLTSYPIVRGIEYYGDKNTARNIGSRQAQGSHLLHLDHDMIAEKNLLGACLQAAKTADTVIVPEKGAGGSFWQNCKRLEKELVMYDPATVTPRFYKKTLFDQEEKPFDPRCGSLDEWGFGQALARKKARATYAKSHVIVNETGSFLQNNFIKKFKHGRWLWVLYKINKQQAWTRTNPIRRGLVFYGRRISYFLHDPAHFTGLLILKSIHLAAFSLGCLTALWHERDY